MIIGSDNLIYFNLGCNDGPACSHITQDDIKQMKSIINGSDIVIYIGDISVYQEGEMIVVLLNYQQINPV